ncbi:putative kinesin light chain [Rosellinia necatrix]|uniref:Putative kinesin light chain n=1 Tax=Rosellinia necatrix TaxID=77044 RepID=A0A1S7UP82_ROSNE|nr:putative kinesin light chain [Rosellinia necatrix]
MSQFHRYGGAAASDSAVAGPSSGSSYQASFHSSPERPTSRHGFEIAIICALPLEADAVDVLFDHYWDETGPPYNKAPGDPNAYTTGAIGRLNVVLAHMPGMGKANSAAVAAHCRASFPNVKLAIVVGICGAAPFGPDGSEIVLGDVIISNGVIQYDFGRRYPDCFIRKDTLSESLGRPNTEIRSLLSKLQGHRHQDTLKGKIAEYLNVVQRHPKLHAQYPGAKHDKLYIATYHHAEREKSCDEGGCKGPLVRRDRLEQAQQGSVQPDIHIGLIASGDTVMKSGEERDSIAKAERVIGFEMEGAGVWDSIPCLVIKGVCDYADSHKNKIWQRYAAATAAASLKAFLEHWTPSVPTDLGLHHPIKQHIETSREFSGYLPERPESPPQPSFMVPFSRDPDFVARESILDQLWQACSGPSSRAALVGLGGVGKSQLVIEHTYRAQDTFSEQNIQNWVFWVHAATRARIDEGFKAIADAAKIRGRDQPNVNIVQLVCQWLQDERHGKWLLILDSADDANVFYGKKDKERQTADTGDKRALWTYLPQSPNGSFIITTRDKELACKITGGHKNVIEVGPMDQDHALKLLAAKSGSQYDENDGIELVKALDYMALAISQAGAYIQRRQPRTSVEKYLAQFRRGEKAQQSLLNHDDGDLRRDREASNSVIATWEISFDYIRGERASATNLLALMSFFDCQGILESLIRPTDQSESDDPEDSTDNGSPSFHETSDDAFEKDIAMLRDYCLVKTNEEGDVFEMHGLVQLSTRKWLDAHNETERFRGKFIRRMAQAFPSGEFENWGTCRKLFPHIEKAMDYSLTDKEAPIVQKDWAILLHNASLYSFRQGKYSLAEMMAKEAHAIGKDLFGLDSNETLISMGNLASVYWNQGRWTEAEQLGVQVIEKRKTILGPDHPDTLVSMSNLASVYENQGRWTEAEQLGVQVIERKKTVLGPDHPDTLISMGNLASVYENQGRWTEAEQLGVQVIERRKTVLGPDHPDTLISMGNLALVYWSQGRWTEAEKLGVQVLERKKTVLGPDHPYTLISMGNLALVYQNQGRWTEAEKLGVQVIERRKTVLGPDHPDTLISMNNLARGLYSMGRRHDGIELMEQCTRARIRVLGSDHPYTQSSLKALQRWRTEEQNAERLEDRDIEQSDARSLSPTPRVRNTEEPDTQMSVAAPQGGGTEERGARKERWRPRIKNAITSIRTRIRGSSLHRDLRG